MIIENTNVDLTQKPSFCQTLVTGSTGLNVLSLFDGMSCGQIALQKAGIKVNQYFASEIKPHAIKKDKIELQKKINEKKKKLHKLFLVKYPVILIIL